MTTQRFLLVGEKPSDLAQQKGLVWADGGLAAKQLFDALRATGHDPALHVFFNLFGDRAENAEDDEATVRCNADAIRALAATNRLEVVAMGRKVSTRLTGYDVSHRLITHPAARGAIRGKAVYTAHIADRLGL